MEKFLEITKKDKGFDKENSWYKVCKERHIPFITIKSRSKLADVQWDYISYPPTLDESLFSQHHPIKAKISAIYDQYATKDTWFGVGPGVITFKNIEIATAREVASKLYDIIDEAAQISENLPIELAV